MINRSISLPTEVKIVIEKEKIIFFGSKGKSELLISPQVEIIHQENKVFAKSNNLALTGTFNSLIYNMIEGVKHGHKEILELKGAGYKVILKNQKLELTLGKSHLDYVDIPSDLKLEIERNKITIMGLDKQKVRQFARNNLQSLCPPSIYKKDKGIYLAGEEKNIQLRSVKNLRK